MKCVTDNCSYSCDKSCELEPYGDIAGLGVLLGFLITAYLVVTLLLGYYIFIYDPSLTPFRAIEDRETKTPHPNIVDEIFIGLVRKIPILNYSRINSQAAQANGSKLEGTLNKCVLLFADIQLVTGTAILISGFFTIRCGLSTYHWQLIVYLAWFSSITHLSTLTFLRHYFQSHRTEKLCRAVGMFLMLALLCFAIVPTAHFFWLDPDDQSATKSPVLPNHHASTLFSIFLLAYGYFVRLAKMSPRLTAAPHKIVRALKEKEKSASNSWHLNISGSWRQFLYNVVLAPLWVALLRWIHIHVDSFTSMFAEVRRDTRYTMGNPGGENTWTFGQILPLALLAAPLLSVVEYFIEYKISLNTTKYPQVPQSIQMTTLPGPNGCDTGNIRPGTSSHSFVAYDSSYAGVIFLTAWYYGLVAGFIFTNAPSNYATVMMVLSVEVLLFQPTIQISWLLWCLWLEKVQFRATIVSSLRIPIFFALFFTSLHEFADGYATALEARKPGIAVATLVKEEY
ncbi:hypothetical protein NM208_g7802 [Fusarium decemcellulare]|uniref:Uncharacterized protein n=1 Tax=Fusarium decemcellulare TaxID=57161 RepID=A0ACC1S7R5_9HYPO|nr:hypothetical protein NM208_g7802 [Fusarium decemcellulare]